MIVGAILLSTLSLAAGQGLNACAALECAFDEICSEVTYHCSTAPCAPRVECVPRDESCLVSRCGPTEQCVVKRKFCSRMEAHIVVLPECKHLPTCVPRFPRCPLNEVYRECNGIDCEPTCNEQNKLCTSGCGTGGCVCEEGLVRHEGRCIPADGCPKPDCPLFELWDTCPGMCEERSCDSDDHMHIDLLACKKQGCGSARCVCYPGYVRDRENSCVPKFFCSQGENFKSSIKELLANTGKDKVKITPGNGEDDTEIIRRSTN